MNKTLIALTSFFVSASFSSIACAHVSIDPPIAETGATWRGVVRVGHGCDGAPTTALDVKLPQGVTAMRVAAKPGWQVMSTPDEIVWTADRGQSLDSKQPGEFALELRVPSQAGAVWVKALQRCQGAAMDWSQVPAQGASTEGMKTPAVLLQVMTPAQAAAWRMRPAVEGAWVRASVPGQKATGAFMRITAKEPMQLVGVASPVAGVAEVHEMKMDGDVMRMRPAGTIDLVAGRAFELTPGGYHVMLQDLKSPLEAGGSVPITLVFRNAKGEESRVDVRAPVALTAPGGGMAGMAGMPGMDGMHKH